MRDLNKKAVMLILSMVLLVATVFYASFAWYTKMTSSSGLDFKTAKWDVSANYQQDDFKVNVYEYNTIGAEKYAAPGVWGFIPIEMTASGSNTSVAFVVTVDKSSMSREFRDRMYFYYYTGDGNPPANYALPAKSDLKELIATGADKTSIIGTVEFGGENKSLVCIYWHWVYDYAEYLEIADKEQSKVAEIIEMLEGDDSYNMSLLCDSDMEQTIFKTSGLMPIEQYYTRSDVLVRAPYDMSNWESAVIKPTLYESADPDEPKVEGEPDPHGTYYYDTYYPPYTGTKPTNSSTVLYVLRDGKYEESEFRYENEVFKKTYSNGTVKYYALTNEQITTLKSYRTAMLADPESGYTDTARFFENYYANYESKREAFDEFDTQVGLNPNAYMDQMNATVLVTGEHVTPSNPQASN